MKSSVLILMYTFFFFHAQAQEDSLLTDLISETIASKSYSSSAFKGTRLINGHTVELPGKKTLEFRVGHRFADVAGGAESFWGLDNANMNLTLDYGLRDRLMIGVGRNSYQKLYEGTVKYKLLRQRNSNLVPFSMVILAKGNIFTNTKGVQYDNLVSKLSYYTELIIGRKFSKALSFQLSPGFVHINLAPETLKSNNIVAITASGRYKFSRSAAVTGEYTQTLNNYYYQELVSYIPVFSFGFDLETGGHVFQLFFTNAVSLNETQYIPFTTTDWGRNQFRFGFNISRTFGFGKKTKGSTY